MLSLHHAPTLNDITREALPPPLVNGMWVGAGQGVLVRDVMSLNHATLRCLCVYVIPPLCTTRDSLTLTTGMWVDGGSEGMSKSCRVTQTLRDLSNLTPTREHAPEVHVFLSSSYLT